MKGIRTFPSFENFWAFSCDNTFPSFHEAISPGKKVENPKF